MRILLAALLGVASCTHETARGPSPAPVPQQQQPAPVANRAEPVAAAPPAPAPTAKALVDSEWTGCMFAKADLAAHHHPAIQIVPDGGFALVLARIEGDAERTQAYVAWIGIAKAPAPSQPMLVQGVLDDRMSEFGNRTGVETSYEIHGTIVASSDGASLDVTLASNQQPHMFDGPPLQHFSVPVQRLQDPEKCDFKKIAPKP